MIRLVLLLSLSAVGIAHAGEIDSQQEQYFTGKYGQQKNAPKPQEMLVNTDKEPDLHKGFTPLFNGKDLSGWTPKGGFSKFEAKDGIIVGTCVHDTSLFHHDNDVRVLYGGQPVGDDNSGAVLQQFP